MIFSPEAARTLGSEVASRRPGKVLDDRTFSAFYGRTPAEVAEIWDLCSPRIQPKTKPSHLFWTLFYMKVYCSIDVAIIILDTTKPTFDKWVWKWIEAISMRHVDVVSEMYCC